MSVPVRPAAENVREVEIVVGAVDVRAAVVDAADAVDAAAVVDAMAVGMVDTAGMVAAVVAGTKLLLRELTRNRWITN